VYERARELQILHKMGLTFGFWEVAKIVDDSGAQFVYNGDRGLKTMRTLILGCWFICPILAQSTQNVGNPPAQVRPAPVISITKDGSVWINEQRTDASHVAETIQKRFGAAQVVYLRADKEVLWTPVAQVVTALKSAKPPMTVNLVTNTKPLSPNVSPR
jgi:hypothetical protein